ncbi:Uncharacterised protein [Serratia fonticola]|uniref:Uncharacterized protein n=1 Tax=Serratia fonticola TaxID=47917 RepID=A0A4U9WML1_SERFO|nr:Uncharacterised protein [Serratia fonticola]
MVVRRDRWILNINIVKPGDRNLTRDRNMLTLAVVVNAESKKRSDRQMMAEMPGSRVSSTLAASSPPASSCSCSTTWLVVKSIPPSEQRLDACANTPKGHAVVKFAGEFSQ